MSGSIIMPIFNDGQSKGEFVFYKRSAARISSALLLSSVAGNAE